MKIFKKKSTGFISLIELQKPKVQIIYWCFFLILLLFAVISLAPFVWVFLSGFKDTKEFLSATPTLFPKKINLGKLVSVWKSSELTMSYLSTTVMVAGNVFFCVIIDGLAGYVLSRLKPVGSKLVFMLVFWTMMMPTTLNMVPLFMFFVDTPIFHINMTDTYWAMWISAGANAFKILIFKSFFDSISISYIEAARIDGLGNFKIFLKIIMPLSKAVIATVAIFTVKDTWGTFLWPYLMIKNPNIAPIGVKIFNLRKLLSCDEYMIALFYSVLPTLIVFILFQKHIMEGFTIGGVKG